MRKPLPQAPVYKEPRRNRVSNAARKKRTWTQKKKGTIELAERHAKAMDLRKQGKTYREIAAEMGLSIITVQSYVKEELLALRTATLLDTESLRDMELERCDLLFSKLSRGIAKGEPAAIGAALRVLERRAALLGLDAPKRTEWIGAMTAMTPENAARMTDTELQNRINALKEKFVGSATLPSTPDLPSTDDDPIGDD